MRVAAAALREAARLVEFSHRQAAVAQTTVTRHGY
jgi:hypothetical protein